MISFKCCSSCCTQEQPKKKRYETTKTHHCQPCGSDEKPAKDQDLLAASALLNTVAFVLKLATIQLASLKKENQELRMENSELRKQTPANKKIDVAA